MATQPTRPSRTAASGRPAKTTASGRPAKTAASGRPAALRVAAAGQAIEAAGLCAASGFAAASTADGRSYQQASGIALTLIALGTAAVLAVIAAGLAKARPWSRIPAGMTQLFVVIAGITLLDGHRAEWGAPALALAVICLAGLLAPASLRALNRPPRS